MNFSELTLHPELMQAIDGLGYQTCTPVQEHTIPALLEGKDVAGLAQTGTGKTAAFLVPMFERILRARELKTQPGADLEQNPLLKRAFADWVPMNFVLVLVPTRELAEQVYENASRLGSVAGLRAVSIYGGVSYDKQKEGLRGGVEFVIATPGRLIDLYKDNTLDLKQVRCVIFDEADRMFDMGFKEDMKFILSRIPRDRQFCVFSATLNLDVMNTAYQFGANPIEFNVSRDQTKAENVSDKIMHVGQDEKGSHLLAIFKKLNPKQAIVFSNFKMNVPRLAQFLSDNGVPAVGISSLLTQSQRNRVMEQFKGDSEKNVLVATDVAARGLDIKGVDLVVNFELPDDPENYVHRIGRTGRAGATGTAYSLVSDRDIDALTRIEAYLKTKVATDFFDEADIPKEYKAMSDDRGSKDFSREFRGERSQGGGPRSAGAQQRRGGGGSHSDRSHGRSGGGGKGPRGDHKRTGAGLGSAGGGSSARPEPRPQGEGRIEVKRDGATIEPRGHQHSKGKGSDSRRIHTSHGSKDGNGSRHSRPVPKDRSQSNRSQPGKGGGKIQPVQRGPIPQSGAGLGQKVANFFKRFLG